MHNSIGSLDEAQVHVRLCHRCVNSANHMLIDGIALLRAFFAVHAGRRQATWVVNLMLTISKMLQGTSVLLQLK